MPSHTRPTDIERSPMGGMSNPIPPGRYDVIVLGADRAARWAAGEAASLGARVAWLIGDGADLPPSGTVDGVDVYRGAPHFIAPDALHLAGRRLHFVRALIAVGATPIEPSIDGLAAVPRLSAAALADPASPPRRIAVVGAGATGCAAAQALARRGSRVTLFEAEARILPREAPEASALIGAALTADGVRVRPGRRGVAVAKQARAYAITSESSESDDDAPSDGIQDDAVDAVFLAAGRRSEVGALDLGAAAVEMLGHRMLLDARLRTTNARIFAAGDAALDHPSAHGALAAARVALRNALFDGRGRVDVLTIPRIVWTVPQLASVGLLAHEPEAHDVPLDTFVHRVEATDRALAVSNMGDASGFVAFHLAAGTDALLGATVVGPDAATAIGEVAHAIDAGTPLGELARVIRPPGAYADALSAVADDARRRRRSPGGSALASRWLAARRAWSDRAPTGG